MSISTNYGVGSYDPSFYDLVKHDISEVEKKGGFAKLDTLADLRASGDKLMKTEDIESLMKKYDSDSYATFSKIGKTQDGAYSKEQIKFLDKWVSDVKKGNIIENLYDNKLWKKDDISDDKSRSDVARVDTQTDYEEFQSRILSADLLYGCLAIPLFRLSMWLSYFMDAAGLNRTAVVFWKTI